GDGSPERLDATSREDRRERHLRYRHAGKTRSGSWRFLDPALNRVDMAGASLTVGRTDRRSDNWRCCVHAHRRDGNFGSGAAGRPPCGLVGNCTAAGLTTGPRSWPWICGGGGRAPPHARGGWALGWGLWWGAWGAGRPRLRPDPLPPPPPPPHKQ